MFDAAILALVLCNPLSFLLGAWVAYRAGRGKSPLPPVSLPAALRPRPMPAQKPDPDAKEPRRSRP